MKIRIVGISGITVILLVAVIGCAAFFWREPNAFVTLGSPKTSLSSYEVAITNASARLISYRLLPLQMKCNGVWMDHIILRDEVITRVSHRPTTIPVITWRISGETLAPGQGNTIPGRVPRYISSPTGATSWRAGVEWSYSTPSKMEQWQNKAIRFVTGRPQAFRPLRYTNYTSEVAF